MKFKLDENFGTRTQHLFQAASHKEKKAMERSLADLRSEYTQRGLSEDEVAADPFTQFQTWFSDALAAHLAMPNAMTLATATRDGKPSARIVLLKGFDERGFVFYSNYESQKGHDLAENPWASLVFLWAELERQVRIEGPVEYFSAAESDAYFQSRPRGSQLGACISQQSQVISSREILDERFQQLMAEHPDRDVARPPYWGGYRLSPTSLEFWQGRPNRLHDRLRYRFLPDGRWLLERLSP